MWAIRRIKGERIRGADGDYDASFDPAIHPGATERIATFTGMTSRQKLAVARILVGLYQVYRKHDCKLVEVNPLALTEKGALALDARVDAAGNGLEHAIVSVKSGSKTEPWQIDAISGATISSKAVARMLNDSARQAVPVIMRHLDVLQRPDGDTP